MLKHYFFLFSMKALTLHLLSIVDAFDGWLIFERYCGMDLTKDSSFPFFFYETTRYLHSYYNSIGSKILRRNPQG